jgi:hypothetical protein
LMTAAARSACGGTLPHLDVADELVIVAGEVEKRAPDALDGVLDAFRAGQRIVSGGEQVFVMEPAALLLPVEFGSFSLSERHEIAPVECYFADNGRRPRVATIEYVH